MNRTEWHFSHRFPPPFFRVAVPVHLNVLLSFDDKERFQRPKSVLATEEDFLLDSRIDHQHHFWRRIGIPLEPSWLLSSAEGGESGPISRPSQHDHTTLLLIACFALPPLHVCMFLSPAYLKFHRDGGCFSRHTTPQAPTSQEMV